jgi:hypothetical protein
METWRHRHGNVKTWRNEDMETWRYRHGKMETWRNGDMKTWRHGRRDIETSFAQCLYVYRLLIMKTEVSRSSVCWRRNKRKLAIWKTVKRTKRTCPCIQYMYVYCTVQGTRMTFSTSGCGHHQKNPPGPLTCMLNFFADYHLNFAAMFKFEACSASSEQIWHDFFLCKLELHRKLILAGFGSDCSITLHVSNLCPVRGYNKLLNKHFLMIC